MKAAVVLALVALLSASASPAAASATQLSVDLKVDSIVPSAEGAAAPVFTGVFTITKDFIKHGDGLAAVGTVTGTLKEASGKTVSVSVPDVVYPIADIQTAAATRKMLATCPILNLVLGPLALDLLGLQVNLAQVLLNIGAQAGVGNLLGNLLCDVANLLNPGTGLSAVVDSVLALLNRILAALSIG